MKSLIFLLIFPLLSFGQKSFFDYLDEKKVKKIDLISDFDELIISKKQNIKIDALAIFYCENSEVFSRSVGLEPRGKFRRKVCDFPPLKLRFDNKDLISSDFLPYNEWKLVTHCTSNLKEARNYLRKEFLIYQLLYAFDTSFFQTKWMEISYRDIQPNAKSINAPSFIIEDKEELASRKNYKICDCSGSTFQEFDQKNLALVSIFQFLIGNADWDIPMMRNIEILINEEGQKILVPYDFDYSGLVNPSYGLPNKDFQLKSMRDRVYLGPNLAQDEYLTLLNDLNTVWPSWQVLITNSPELSKKDKEDILRYLEKSIEYLKSKNELSTGTVFYDLP